MFPFGNGQLPGFDMGGGGAFGFLSGGNTPQDRGFGISGGQQFTPYSTGIGLTQGQAPGMQGLDFSRQGAGEAFFGNNMGQYQAPGLGEAFAGQVLNKYGGAPQLSNNQGDYFKQFQASRPSVAAEPGFGAYYDNAKRRAAESINQQAAARGSYGSSGAIDRVSEAFTDLEADRAKNEANYNLQRLGEERAWTGLGGHLAGAADQNSIAGSQNAQNWLNTVAGIANNGQQLGMSRLGQGMNAAGTAQGLQRQRGRDFLGDQISMGSILSGMAGDAYNQMMMGDQQLMDSSIMAQLGLAGEAQNQGYRGEQEVQNGFNQAMDLAGMMFGAGGMGKFLGGLK